MPNNQTGKRYEYNGQWLTIRELAHLAGIDPQVLRGRICRLKWSVADAVETPLQVEVMRRNLDSGITFQPNGIHLYLYKGEKRTLRELSELSGIASTVLYSRIIKRKWSIAAAVEKPVKTGRRKPSNTPQPRNVTHTVAGWGAIKHIA